MADNKNFINIERGSGIVGANSEIKNNQENVSSSRFEIGSDGTQAKNKIINESVGDARAEGEFGGVQPIDGFTRKNIKRQKDIEDVMSNNMRDIYLQLSPEKQQEFKIKGEETAQRINDLLDKAKIEIGKIIDLLKQWLLVVPGINKFFVEQEAKIKADEIIKLKI